MTFRTCIRGYEHVRPVGLANGSRARAAAAQAQAAKPLCISVASRAKEVTLLMARAAPSNFGVKQSAGRSPRPGLKPLFTPEMHGVSPLADAARRLSR
jgi:hypothetical protein